MLSDAHGVLIRALLARGGEQCRLVGSGERPWASITFEGARHIVEVALPADAAIPFLTGIEEAEFDLRAHLLADLAVAGSRVAADGRAHIRVEALTLVDPEPSPERTRRNPRLRDHGRDQATLCR